MSAQAGWRSINLVTAAVRSPKRRPRGPSDRAQAQSSRPLASPWTYILTGLRPLFGARFVHPSVIADAVFDPQYLFEGRCQARKTLAARRYSVGASPTLAAKKRVNALCEENPRSTLMSAIGVSVATRVSSACSMISVLR